MRIVKILDSFAMGSSRTTFVGFRLVPSDSGLIALGVSVGDSKLALFRDGQHGLRFGFRPAFSGHR